MSFEVVLKPPGVDDYRRVRAAAGLDEKTVEAAERGLAGTWFGVSVLHGNSVVGMGRIVGDGGCFFQIVDIAVVPEHQGKGLGKSIMRALTAHLEEHAPRSAYASLIADGEAHRLYRQFGFQMTAPQSVGMFKEL